MSNVSNQAVFKKRKKEVQQLIRQKLFHNGLTIDSFAEKYYVEVESFRKQFYDSKRMLSIDVIKNVERECNECDSNLRENWISLRLLQRQKNLIPFVTMPLCDLIWIVNNLDTLLKLTEIQVVFFTYVRLLNIKGQQQLLRYMNYIIEDLFASTSEVNSINLDFIASTKDSTKDHFDCFIEIEDCEELWKIPPKVRNPLIDLWRDFQDITDLERNIICKFANYGNTNPARSSDAQKSFFTIILLLCREPIYCR